jgi:hypothetical protein
MSSTAYEQDHSAAVPPSSVMNSRLFIDRIASDPPSQECMAEYRIGKDQFNVTDEGIIFLREATPVSTWTEHDKRIATRALKTLEEASVASRGAAIYYLETVRREMGIKRPDDIPERSDAWLAVCRLWEALPNGEMRSTRRRLGLTPCGRPSWAKIRLRAEKSRAQG